MLRILIADPYPIVTKSVENLIRGHPEWLVVARVHDPQEALARVREEQPDLIVLGTLLANVIDLTAVKASGRRVPDVLVHSARSDSGAINDAISGGARGYVLKSDGADCLEAGISSVARGQAYFSPSVADILCPLGDKKPFHLTDREREVAQLIAEGWKNKAIAQKLELSIKTVESHRGSAMRKAGTNRTADFVRFAIQHNLIAA